MQNTDNLCTFHNDRIDVFIYHFSFVSQLSFWGSLYQLVLVAEGEAQSNGQTVMVTFLHFVCSLCSGMLCVECCLLHEVSLEERGGGDQADV